MNKKPILCMCLVCAFSLPLAACQDESSSQSESSIQASEEKTSLIDSSDSDDESSSSLTSILSSRSSLESTESGTYTGHYYDSINAASLTDGLNGTLRAALTTLIQPEAYYTYGGDDGTDNLSYILQEADEDPANSGNMVFFYSQASVTKGQSDSGNYWNREHVWPQSLSGGLYGKTGGGTDILHIRPTFATTNSKRGSCKFGELPATTPMLSLTYQNVAYTYGKQSGDVFEPKDTVKGDVSRICAYMYVCYFASRGTPLTNVFLNASTLLSWHNLDPVSQIEIGRNDCAEGSKQKNRNPFVDHPEWVSRIFN